MKFSHVKKSRVLGLMLPCALFLLMHVFYDVGEDTRQLATDKIVNTDATNAHRLCGCGVCATVSFETSYPQRESNDAPGISASVTLNVIEPPDGWEEGWYDLVLLGNNGVYASPISPAPNSDIKSLSVSQAGFYRVSLSPSHRDREQAMGTSKNQEKSIKKEAPCPLLMKDPFPAGSNSSDRFAFYPRIEVTLPAASNQGNLDVDEIETPLDDYTNYPFWVVDNSCDYELYFDPVNKVFPLCHRDHTLKNTGGPSSGCHGDTKDIGSAILLGDSHAHELTTVMTHYHPELTKRGWYQPDSYHGDGIYHNLSPDHHFDEYIKGIVQGEFVEGKMLRHLRNGDYKALQKDNKFDTWFFESGAWDLRDVSLEVYEDRVTELLDEFVKFRESFKDTDSPLRLVWLGVPAFSFKRFSWGGMEKRTNVKHYKAHLATAQKAKERNIDLVPFFDVTYPVFRQSCDTHHYVCSKLADYGKPLKAYDPIGHEIVKLVIDAGSTCLKQSAAVE